MKNIIYKIISASLSAFILMSALTLDSFGYEFEYINYHWARDDIQKLADAGIFTGITQSRFEPDVYVTRGMVAVTVCRMLNVDPEDRVAFFKDVDNNRYYAPYIAWAYEKNILTGYSDMTFRAEAPVTRQEMFCIMQRVIGYGKTNFDFSSDFELKYSDTDQISDYALNAVRFLSDKGYIHGDDKNMINPAANITRAEFSSLAAKVMGLSETQRPLFNEALEKETSNNKETNDNNNNNDNNNVNKEQPDSNELQKAKDAFKNGKKVSLSYKDNNGDTLTVIYSKKNEYNVCYIKFNGGTEIYIEDESKTVYENNKGRLITYINVLDSFDNNAGSVFDSDFGGLGFINSYISNIKLNNVPEISYDFSFAQPSFLTKLKSVGESDSKLFTVENKQKNYSETFSVNKDSIVMVLGDNYKLFTDTECENEFKSSDFIGNNKSVTLYVNEITEN